VAPDRRPHLPSCRSGAEPFDYPTTPRIGRGDHPNLVDAKAGRPGHGVLLWFQVDDFDATVERARSLRVEVIEEPHVNPAPRHREMWIRDPDGYVVVIASPDGEAG
jgi:predicted enzyme related to lactoylglutathione lyase